MKKEADLHSAGSVEILQTLGNRFICMVQSPKGEFIGCVGIDTPKDPKIFWTGRYILRTRGAIFLILCRKS